MEYHLAVHCYLHAFVLFRLRCAQYRCSTLWKHTESAAGAAATGLCFSHHPLCSLKRVVLYVRRHARTVFLHTPPGMHTT